MPFPDTSVAILADADPQRDLPRGSATEARVAQGDIVTRRCLRGIAQIAGQAVLRIGRASVAT